MCSLRGIVGSAVEAEMGLTKLRLLKQIYWLTHTSSQLTNQQTYHQPVPLRQDGTEKECEGDQSCRRSVHPQRGPVDKQR